MCFIQDLSCFKKISTGSYLIHNMFKNNKSLVSCWLLIAWYDIISILVGNTLFYQYENVFRKFKGTHEVTKLVRGSPQKKIWVYFLPTLVQYFTHSEAQEVTCVKGQGSLQAKFLWI